MATVILVRHEHHGQEGLPQNVLTLEGRERAIASGHRLVEEFGLDRVEAAFISPQGRCFETAQCLMQGMGFIAPFHTDDRLGDLAMDPKFGEEGVRDLVKAAREAGLPPEEYFLRRPDYQKHVQLRGTDAARFFWGEPIRIWPKGTILVCSHGGSVLEPLVMTLLKEPEPPFLFEMGGVALANIPLGLKVESIRPLFGTREFNP